MTDIEKEVFESIRFNPSISIVELAEKLSFSIATVNNSLRSLKQKNYIKRSESEMSKKWIVLEV